MQFDLVHLELELVDRCSCNKMVNTMRGGDYRLLVNKGATTLMFGYLDVNLVRKFAIFSALASDNSPLGHLYGSAANILTTLVALK